ncbi:MAG: GerW family sporulation protein [Lachnospiraceae bacterium]|nr:GerW family sporulation protein [Lachnospiraceae bacterium]
MAENHNAIGDVVRSFMDGAGAAFASKTVIGDPVVVGDTTIIPLCDITIGCAAGSNNAERKDNGAGGFAAKASPSAVLIIRGGTVKVVNIKNQDAVTKLVDLIPDVIDRFAAPKSERDVMSDDDAVELAFGSGKDGSR